MAPYPGPGQNVIQADLELCVPAAKKLNISLFEGEGERFEENAQK